MGIRLAMMGLAALFAATNVSAIAAAPSGIVTYGLENEKGSIEHDVPVTFGSIFAPGDVPAGSSVSAVDREGRTIPLQVDVKARHKDGSLRHAVLTLDVPHLATGHTMAVTIVPGGKTEGTPVALSALPPDFDVVVDLSEGGRHVKASVRDLMAHEKPDTWLSGPLVSEWWFAGPLRDSAGKPDPHLSVRFGIRSYGKDRPLRLEVDVENDWTWVADPRTEIYDATIAAAGKTLFTQQDMKQAAQTRWRKVYWWNQQASVFVKQDLDYLKKARVIPNYNPDAKVTAQDLDRLYAGFARSDRSPLGTGIVTDYMPMTGGRMDIGPLPTWTVYYLLTMDKRAAQVMFSAADLGGSYGSHYRNEKTGRPVSTEEYPNISTHSNYIGRPGNLAKPDTRGVNSRITAQSAHEPSLDFIPYVVSGERYYLEELEFWSQWNSWGTAPQYHGFGQNLVKWDEVRGQGWSLRTLAQAAYITPDSDPMKATLLREIHANLAFYNKDQTYNPAANVFHSAGAWDDYSPWMDDFLTWAAGYAAQLGFDDAKPYAEWKGVFPTQRLINPQYCWILATSYRIVLADAHGKVFTNWSQAYKATFTRFAKEPVDPQSVKCGSEAMAKALGLQEGEMLGSPGNPAGYPANMQPAQAAAVDAGTPGAVEAWKKLRSRPMLNVDPTWDIIPWTPVKP